MRYIKLSFLFLAFIEFSLQAQYSIQENRGLEVKDSSIGNIQFHPLGNSLEFPLISIYDSEPLLLKFDIFSTIKEELYYKIELCNYDWSPSELDVMEYVEGYPENSFYAFSDSYNTTINYVHYQLEIPNDDVQFLLSGNYILTIYRADTKEDVLSRRFIVYEPSAEVGMQVDKFQTGIYSGEQALNVTVFPESVSYSDLAGNINLAVIQNGNWNQLKSFNKYNSEGNNRFAFNIPGQIVYDAGNEYRYFDIKSLKFQSEYIEYMEYKPPYTHVYLKPDKLKGEKDYYTEADLNGGFYIWNQETHDPDLLDAEYAYVHFTLETDFPIGADVYIEGAITDWQIKDNSMVYYPETGRYEASLLLKQGIYNYRYVTREYNSKKVYCDITEGNHFLTGNDYRAFLYYREMGTFYDQVIGVGRITTGKPLEEHDKDREPNAIEKLLKEIAPR